VTGRAAAIQGGLAAIGLLTAALTWQREPERAAGAVAIIDAGKSDVTLIKYEDENNTVEFRPGKGGGDAKVWLHLVPKPKAEPTEKEKAAKEPPPGPHGKPPKVEKADKPSPPRTLPGGENAVKLYEAFGPLISPRAFGALDGAKLKELGLDAPKRKLEVTVKGDVRRYEIGQPANAVGGESFIRDTRDGRVYLMPRTMLTELQNAAQLIDRRFHTFELAEFDKIVLTAGGKSKDFIQVGRESRATAGFASPKTPDKRDQMAKNWHDAIWRTFPSDILGKGEEPTGGKPAVVLRVDYYDGKKALGWLEMGKVETAGGTMSDDAPKDTSKEEFYARTEHTAGWAKLHSGTQLLSDAQKLIEAK
jgi:hypothetical protein